MSRVRAKFRCISIELFSSEPGGNRRVKLSAVTAGQNASEEDKAFWKYTPSGTVEMTIDNPPASEMFEIGKTYYLDFTVAEK